MAINVFYCAWNAAPYDGGYMWFNIMSSSSLNSTFKNDCGGDIIVE